MRKLALILVCVIGSVFSTEVTAASSFLFGPKTYTRTSGQPDTYRETFVHCEPDSQYKLVISYGDKKGHHRFGNATILLNGHNVFKTRNRNRKLVRFEKPVEVQSENTLEVHLKTRTGGQLTISIECVENCFEVQITSPPDLSEINRGEVLVTGVLHTSTEEVGVVVNGVVAQVNGDQFAANKIPLGLGENTLIAAATNACGKTTEATARIQVDSIRPQAHLSVLPATGAAPLDAMLQITTFLDRPITQYQWDFTGDGAIDASGPALTDYTTTYTQEGLFFPTVIITDDQETVYTTTAVVNVISFSRIDALIQQKWRGMKSALEHQDVEEVLDFFSDGAKPMFRENFTLMKDILPEISADMGEIKFVRFVRSGAIYEMNGVQEGRELSFHVEFVKDIDGLWKIRFL